MPHHLCVGGDAVKVADCPMVDTPLVGGWAPLVGGWALDLQLTLVRSKISRKQDSDNGGSLVYTVLQSISDLLVH